MTTKTAPAITFPAQDTHHAIALDGPKEVVDTCRLVVWDGAAIRVAVDLRLYTGRSQSASVVYAALWLRSPDGRRYGGSGRAGGGGYCKRSAAAEAALTDAGVTGARPFGGAGLPRAQEVLEQVATAMGWPAQGRAWV